MSSLTSTGCSRKRVTLREKEIIIGNFFENNSITQTARVVGRSKSVVSRIVKRYNEENSLDEKKKLGRPLKTDAREDRELVRMAKSDRFQSSRKLASKFAAGISHQTVIRRLGKVGFKSKVAAVKPLISKKIRENAWSLQECIRLGLSHNGTAFISVTSPSLTFLETTAKGLFGVKKMKSCLQHV